MKRHQFAAIVLICLLIANTSIPAANLLDIFGNQNGSADIPDPTISTWSSSDGNWFEIWRDEGMDTNTKFSFKQAIRSPGETVPLYLDLKNALQRISPNS